MKVKLLLEEIRNIIFKQSIKYSSRIGKIKEDQRELIIQYGEEYAKSSFYKRTEFEIAILQLKFDILIALLGG